MPTPELGCSRKQAARRYSQNEHSLTRKGKWKEFDAAVKEYADLGHSELVLEQDLRKAEAETLCMES